MLTYMESALAFWVMEVLRTSFFLSLSCTNINSSSQIPVHSGHIQGRYSQRRQLCTYQDVVCTGRKCVVAEESTLLNLRNTKPIVPYRKTTKWLFAYIPFIQRVYRFVIAASVCF